MGLFGDYMKVVILLSVPQTFIYVWFSFTLWKLQPRRHIRRIALLSVVNAFAIDADILHVPPAVHTATAFVVTFVVMYALFKPFRLKTIAILFFSLYAVALVSELISYPLFIAMFGYADQKDILTEHLFEMFVAFLPVWSVWLLLSRYIAKGGFPFSRTLYQHLLDLRQNRLKEVLVLTIFQAFLLGTLFLVVTDRSEEHAEISTSVLVFLLVILTFIAFFFTLRLLSRARFEAVDRTQDRYAEEVGNVLTAIRGQRHDFVNHVQVMYTMLQLNKMEQLKAYMGDIVEESLTAVNIVQHSSPALAAFFQAKSEVAAARSIPFRYELPADVDLESKVRDVDLVKMMGNLVDNAFDESDALPAGQRDVLCRVRKEENRLELTVRNQSRPLKDRDRRKMMMPGYTTKKSGHSGLGLAIVKERADYYGGEVDIRFESGRGTTVQIRIPLAE